MILDSYTVYLDLWVIDLQGRVVANGRPQRYPRAASAQVRGQPWFERALATRSGQDFVCTDVEPMIDLGDALVATYGTAIRRGGRADGEPLGVLAIFFDWQAQSQAVVDGVKFTDDERRRARAMLVDAQFQVIASSDGRGVLEETLTLKRRGRVLGHQRLPDGSLIGYARTPGYETYRGMGWYGVITLAPPTAQAAGVVAEAPAGDEDDSAASPGKTPVSAGLASIGG